MLMTIATFVSTLLLVADTTVTGTWNMGLQGDHVIPTALVLQQDGTKITGTIAMPTQHVGQRVEVTLSGTFEGGTMKMAGDVENAKEPTTIKIEGRLLEDGSMEGTLSMRDHSVPWTAERLRERK